MTYLTNDNATAEIQEAIRNGMSTRRLSFETGIDITRRNSGMRDRNFTHHELTQLHNSIKKWRAEVRYSRAC